MTDATDAVALLECSPCGPRAHAAIVGCEPEQAAVRLVPIIRRCGMSPRDGAPAEASVAALFDDGYDVEPWSTSRTGWRELTASQFREANEVALRQLPAFIEAVAQVGAINQAAIADREEMLKKHGPAYVQFYDDELARLSAIRRERSARRRIAPMTVNALRAARLMGTWLCFVAKHVLVVRAGSVIAGDRIDAPTYGEAPLTGVFRVVPPGGVWRARLRHLRR